MKPTKSLWIVLLVAGGLLAGGMALRAQDATNTPPAAGAHGSRGMRGLDRMAQALNLTDEQKPKVRAVFEDMRQQIRDLRQDSSLSNEDRRAKMKTIRENMNAKLKDILTPDQLKKLRELRSKMRHRRNGGNPPPATPPQS